MTKAEIYSIVKDHLPDPIYEVVEIANEFGHHVRYTPPYCHRSAPIEIVWANIKNPIGRNTSAESINDLMRKIQGSKDNVDESILLGAYADELFIFIGTHSNSRTGP